MTTKSTQSVEGSTVGGAIEQRSDAADAMQRIDSVTAGAIRQVVESDASREVKATITDLMNAIQALAPHLPPDERDRLARDATMLADEVASKEPRKPMIKAIGEGLATTARSVRDVGLPVVDLVSKLVALF